MTDDGMWLDGFDSEPTPDDDPSGDLVSDLERQLEAARAASGQLDAPDEPDDGALGAPSIGESAKVQRPEERRVQIIRERVSQSADVKALLEDMRSDSAFLDGMLPKYDYETGQWAREDPRPPALDNAGGPDKARIRR